MIRIGSSLRLSATILSLPTDCFDLHHGFADHRAAGRDANFFEVNLLAAA